MTSRWRIIASVFARAVLLGAIYEGSRVALVIMLAWLQVRVIWHRDELDLGDVSNETRARLHGRDDDIVH
jgi:hypothetical protein